jgi:hypothetical protein
MPPTCFVALKAKMYIIPKIIGESNANVRNIFAKYVSKGNKKYINGIVNIVQYLVLPNL